MPGPDAANPIAPLGREEYVEQSHLFATLAERMREGAPAQEVLQSSREEALATTKLPLAIDFLLSELRHAGTFATAMGKLGHYFTPFQTFVIREAEDDRKRFDLLLGLEVLRRDADYRAAVDPRLTPNRQGLFLFQFETVCRNRLGYDRGLEAIAGDPGFDPAWREWALSIRHKVGMVDLADLIYVHSEHYARRAAGQPEGPPPADHPILFGEQEGRIALANRRKDPLYLFNSLHRQLGYPEVPRPAPPAEEGVTLRQLARRLEQMEKRLSLVEEEQRGGLDLTRFYQRPEGPGG